MKRIEDSMSDKLDWLDHHAVLFLHPTVDETEHEEKYELSSELSKLAKVFPDSESYLEQLVIRRDYGEACRFLAYNMHRRAAIWWGYRCVVDLMNELKKNPAQPRDIADIGKPRPFSIPDWAKEDPNTPEIPFDEIKNQIDKAMADLKAQIDKTIDPRVRKLVDEVVEMFDEELRNKYGKTLKDCLNDAMEASAREKDITSIIDKNSPLFKAEAELRAQLEQVRTEAAETIKSVLPKQDPEKKAKQKKAAMDAVYAYLVSPDDENARLCLDAGNVIPDMPEGLLALSAFWSYGNLAPGMPNIIKTPAGMMANGLNGLMMMSALQSGGELRPKERFEKYYNLGYQVLIGADNWGNSVEEHRPPHKAENGILRDENNFNTKVKSIKPQLKPVVERFRG